MPSVRKSFAFRDMRWMVIVASLVLLLICKLCESALAYLWFISGDCGTEYIWFWVGEAGALDMGRKVSGDGLFKSDAFIIQPLWVIKLNRPSSTLCLRGGANPYMLSEDPYDTYYIRHLIRNAEPRQTSITVCLNPALGQHMVAIWRNLMYSKTIESRSHMAQWKYGLLPLAWLVAVGWYISNWEWSL